MKKENKFAAIFNKCIRPKIFSIFKTTRKIRFIGSFYYTSENSDKFDPDKFNWKHFSTYLVKYCPHKFDPNRFNWGDTKLLFYYVIKIEDI